MSETTKIAVSAAGGGYTVEIGSGLLAQVGERVTALVGEKARVFVITSPEIWRLWGGTLASGFAKTPTVLSVPAGEEHKRLATVERLLEELAEAGADRDSVLLAFGGGVIGDMAGFVAASYMRGIRYVQVPTTALAQIDSSLGGKTGVNLAAGKNLAGAFWQPLAVFTDIDVLSTLPPAELRAGLQEALKAGIIRDVELFDYMERESVAVLAGEKAALLHVISASVAVKAEVVSLDEREGGLRMVLNFGHTLGHAIEAATGYTALLHGEAVAWGMIAAVRLSLLHNHVTADEATRLERVIRAYGPLRPFHASAEELVALTSKDKKNRSGARSFVVPINIGLAAVVNEVTEPELLDAARAIVTEAAAVHA